MTFLCGDLNIFSPQDYYFGTVFCTVTCIFEKVPTYCVMTWSCHNRCDINLTQGENIKQLGYQNVSSKKQNFFLGFSPVIQFSIVKVDFRGIFDGFFKSAFSRS